MSNFVVNEGIASAIINKILKPNLYAFLELRAAVETIK